jgi:hypothetical protein
MLRLLRRVLALPVAIHIGLAGLSVAAFILAKSKLDQSYAVSRHPVDYATGQLAFSAQKIDEYYQSMTDAGTLPVYWRTQLIDFGFIASVALLGLLLGSLAARLWPNQSIGRKVGLAIPFLTALGAGFDAIENLISFWMLSTFPAIPNILALAYSSAAAVKFAFLTCAMLGFAAVAATGLIRIGWFGVRQIWRP